MSIQVVKYQKLSAPINKSLNFNLNCKLRLQQADGNVKSNKLVSCLAVTITSNNADAPSSYWDENYAQPYFDNTTRRDITVTIGQTAMLHCRVRNLGDRAVSFIGLLSIRGGQKRLWGEEPLMIIGLKFIYFSEHLSSFKACIKFEKKIDGNFEIAREN